MTQVTHLTTPQAFDAGQIEIQGDAYRHLFRAKRLATGDLLRVVDGRGRARSGRIETVERKAASVVLGSPLPDLEAALRAHLLVGALRPERASWLVEKATELGVASLTFISTERTPREYGRAKIERWRRVAASALEQCGRAVLPEIEGVVAIEEALEKTPGPRFALMPGAVGFAEVIEEAPELSLVIGPEGGFGPADQALFEHYGVLTAGLGPTILRVETAALAALSLALCR